MANYLKVLVAPDSHIDFIRDHPGSLWAYVDGEHPDASALAPPKPSLWRRMTRTAPPPPPTPEIPEDWPVEEAAMIGPEINHRNVDLYHLILNGTPDFVDGSGCIFQTWLTLKKHSAIDLAGDNENFAFKSLQLPELVDLLSKVDAAAARSGMTQWFRAKGDSYEPDEDECEDTAEEFKAFASEIQKAVDNSHGLIWISN